MMLHRRVPEPTVRLQQILLVANIFMRGDQPHIISARGHATCLAVGFEPSSDAFSLRTTTGTALWMVLLWSGAYSPLAIYAPLFLQRLHGVTPLIAGYLVAGASLAWTCAALITASLTEEWPKRLIVAGPIAMSVGLL